MPPRDRTAAAASIRAPREDLCLDFANTLSWRGSAAPTEALHRLPDVLGWLERAGYHGMPAWSAASALPQRHPKRAAHLFADAIALREVIYRCCAVMASGEAATRPDFARLNQALEAAPERHTLVGGTGGYGWAAEGGADPLSAALLLVPVLWSMADLLCRA